MVKAAAFEFSVMHCQPLRRALGLKGGLSGIIRTSSVIIRGGCR